ncbi:11736_t:CDS:2 [Entrophospora sp. SA101]|nr:11736_t:CDS:2 [Entrophospora sp. SA101]
MVVPYHPETLLFWKAHINFQYVTSTGFAKYITKYVTKSEPSELFDIDEKDDTWIPTEVKLRGGGEREKLDITDITNTNTKKKKQNPIQYENSKEIMTNTTFKKFNTISKKSDVEPTNDVTVLKETPISFFKPLSSYSFLNANEAILQAVTELLLPNNRIPEDINYSIIELKYVNNLSLIRAIKNDWNISPSMSDLADFDKYIENEDESKLLERNLMFWSKEYSKPKVTILNKILSSAEEQVMRYMNIIAHGSAHEGKPGIIDS